MWSTNKRDYCLRSSLLIINCSICVAIVYIYLIHTAKEIKIDARISEEDIVRSAKLTDENCIAVCDSKECTWHANLLLKNIDMTADICENARSFMCGGFEEKFGPGELRNFMEECNKQMVIKLKGVLENIQAKPGTALEKMKTVYDSCINYGSSELQGITDLKNMFNKLGLINWPNLVQDFNFSDISLPKVFGNFMLYADQDYIYLKQVALKDNETEEDRFKVSFFISTFKSSTKIHREIAFSLLKYFDLRSEDIDTIINDHELVRTSIVDLYESIEECDEDCTEIQINCSRQKDDEWRYICETTDALLNLMNYDGQFQAYSLTILQPQHVFYKDLFTVLDSLPDRSVANFLALDFIQRYQEDLNFYFLFSKLKNKHHFQPMDLQNFEINKWKFCVQWIADNLGYPLVNEVLHQYLTHAVLGEAVDFFHEYISLVIDIIGLQQWLPFELKSGLQEEFKSFGFNMDIINQMLPNDTQANRIFRKFHPTSESFFKNILLLKRSVFSPESPISPFHTEYVFLPSFIVNAGFGLNEIALDFGHLFPPFYIPGHMRLMNLGSLALTFGHEFGHAIMSYLELNADKVPENFLSKIQCLIDQTSNFKYPYLNINLNGSIYIDESLADSIGRTLVDKVIDKYSSDDLILPGLSYSTKELLYIIASQMWCTKSSLEMDRYHFKFAKTHPPSEYRLLVNLLNSKGSSEAFHCPEGSFLNSATKCSLFDIPEDKI